MTAARLRDLWALAFHGLPYPTLLRSFGLRRGLRFRAVLGALPILPEGPEGWAPMDLRAATPRDWHVIVAARAGLPCHPCAVPGVALPPPDESTALALPTPEGWRTVRAYEALRGLELVDLVAVTPGWRGPPLRRLLGQAAALGDAAGAGAEEAELAEDPETLGGPIPIARDLRGWLRLAHTGALLPLGDEYERAEYLRRFAGLGLIAEGEAHGLELRRLVKREPRPEPPPIYVPAPKAKAA